jgi:prevent-host-death family protein
MRSKDIQPMSALRSHMSENFQYVQETGRPLFITSNGRTAGVVLSPDAYDSLAEKAEIADNMTLINRGLEDVKAGRVYKAREDIRAIAAERGIHLAR